MAQAGRQAVDPGYRDHAIAPATRCRTNAAIPVAPVRRLAVALCAAIAAGLLPHAAVAQDVDVVGVITGSIGGEERRWSALGMETGEGYESTAYWMSVMGAITTISIQGHAEDRFAVEGALAIELTIFGPLPTECPCAIPEAEVLYWPTSSMFESLYVTDAADVTLTLVEPLDGDAFRIEGAFSATLLFQEGMMDEPDPSETLDVAGTFVVERLRKFEDE